MPTPKLYYAANARAERAEDGLERIETIAAAVVGNPGCEKNTVELVEDMANLIHRQREMISECDVVLTMVPTKSREDSWMGLLHTEYVAPLIEKLRGRSNAEISRRAGTEKNQ